ncbi:MAG: hypothetical protein Q8O51_02490 [bacterium]|nr:hypothetical protein [bacterium]
MKTTPVFLMKCGPARTTVAILGIFGLIMLFSPVNPARAANVTSFKDTQSSLTDSANSNHTISWVSPSGVANAATIVLTFATGFNLTGVVEDDIDIAGSTEGELTTAADCTDASGNTFVTEKFTL